MFFISIRREYYNLFTEIHRVARCFLAGAVVIVTHMGHVSAADSAMQVVQENGLFYVQQQNNQIAQLADIVATGDDFSPLAIEGDAKLSPVDQTRYGLPISYLTTSKGLLQAQLIRDGKAFVMTDNIYAHTQELLELEPPDIPVVKQEDAEMKMHHHAIIRGRVHAVTLTKEATYLNFSDDWKKDFTIHIPKQIAKRMGEQWLKNLKGKTLQVRGYIHAYYGARITLLNPQMMEVIDE